MSRVYSLLLGEEYMQMISQLGQINMAGAVRMMQGDLAVVFGNRPKKTQEEIEQELAEFFAEAERANEAEP